MEKSKSISIISFILLAAGFSSCQPEGDRIADDPVSSLNALMSDYGHIGHKNPLNNAETGTMVAGKPSGLSYIAPSEDCFPSEQIARYEDQSNFTRRHTYSFKGGFGFLGNANNLFSAGLKLNGSDLVNVEMTNMTIEYMSSIDITEWYLEGMNQTCKNYLDDVGFIIQAVKSDNIKISIESSSGTSISFDPNNISDYIEFNLGVEWQIIDQYTVEITTPKYIGYQLGRLRLDDDGRSLYRATRAEEDQFVFERIGLFDDDEDDNLVEKSAGAEAIMDQEHQYYR